MTVILLLWIYSRISYFNVYWYKKYSGLHHFILYMSNWEIGWSYYWLNFTVRGISWFSLFSVCSHNHWGNGFPKTYSEGDLLYTNFILGFGLQRGSWVEILDCVHCWHCLFKDMLLLNILNVIFNAVSTNNKFQSILLGWKKKSQYIKWAWGYVFK